MVQKGLVGFIFFIEQVLFGECALNPDTKQS